MQLSLYHYWRSSCSWRVRWALALKNVPYDSIPVNILAGEHGQPPHLERNPAGLLPALMIDGQFFGESLAIMEWIEETWPLPALLPKNPLARLRVRQLAMTIVAGTQPLQNPSVLKVVSADEAARKSYAQHFIAKGLATYETLLGLAPKGKFSFGNTVTLADICLVPQVYNALRFDVDLSTTPRCREIYETSLMTTACAAAHPSKQLGATA